MRKNTTTASILKPDGFEDELTMLLRHGAQRLLMEAVELELQQFLARHTEALDTGGRKAVVRNGYLPEREIQTGIG